MEEDLFHYETFKSIHLSFPRNNEKQISIDPQSLHPIHPNLTTSPLPSSSSSSTPPLKNSLPHPTLQLRRSKSCGDGRSSSPSDDFNIISNKKPTFDKDSSFSSSDETDFDKDSTFKCSALCLFLPGIYKKKSVLQKQSTTDHNINLKDENGGVRIVSKVASFERFECGSWSSAANLEHEGSGPLSYFDLPLELIRCGANECNSPVRSGFVFDRDLKGVLKKNGESRKSCDSSNNNNNRHVRFSTSSPTSYPASPSLSPCVTPRLVKARNEFNALLEATNG